MMNAAAMHEKTENARKTFLDFAFQSVDQWIDETAIPEMQKKAQRGIFCWVVKNFPTLRDDELSTQVCQYAGNLLDENGYRYDTDNEGTKITTIYW